MTAEKEKKKSLKWHSFRLRTLVICAALLAAAFYIKGRIPRFHMGSGPAGPEVPAEPFEKTWFEGEVAFYGMGDSITNGYGASPGRAYFPLLTKNDDKAIPDMKGRELSRVFPVLKFEEFAIDYTISKEHLERQVPKFPRHGADVLGIVCITSGGNDLIHDYGDSEPEDGALYGCSLEQAIVWGENYRGRLEGIVEGVAAKFAGRCEIFLANIYDPTDGVGDIENAGAIWPIKKGMLPPWPDGLEVLSLWNRIIAETAEKYDYVHLVDIRAAMLGHGLHYHEKSNPCYDADDPHYWYFANLEDPNDRGYDAIRRVFLLKMIEVFAGEKN